MTIRFGIAGVRHPLCRLLSLIRAFGLVGRSRGTAIVVVEAAQDREGDHRPCARTLSRRNR